MATHKSMHAVLCSLLMGVPVGVLLLFPLAARGADRSGAGKPTSAFSYPRTHAQLTAYDEGGAVPDAIETYPQQFTVTFRTETAAKNALVELAPLYNDYQWATSSRWDDCNPADEKMRDVLAQHGYHATWYLNSPTIHEGNFAPFGKPLLAGGNSIGAHGLTHPVLSYVNCNRLFEEVARVRVLWEAAADTQVTCYAFSYCNFRNSMLGDEGQINVHQALRRAGFYLSAERPYNDNLFTDMLGLLLLPGDGAEIDEYVQRALGDKAAHREFPMLSHSMHAWYKTPQEWQKFAGQLDKYGHNPDWWYCNHNQYAAYRYQFLHTALDVPVREGNTLHVRLQRPQLLDLNDPTPLTVRVTNVDRADVLAAASDTADCTVADRKIEGFLFHLGHDRSAALPKTIGLVSNPDNRPSLRDADEDADFPGLKGLLCFDGQQLRLVLNNQTATPLSNVRVTYRLPLCCKEGLVRHVLKEDLRPAAQCSDTLKPTPFSHDYKYTAGTAYYQAQVDFVCGGGAGRLHFDCHVRNPLARDPSYPQGGFARLGLIADDEIDLEQLLSEIKGSEINRNQFLKSPWTLRSGKRLAWTMADDTPFEEPMLDPEMIRTTGSFNCKESGYYLLQSRVDAERAQPVAFRHMPNTVPRVFLNGSEVKNGPATLRQGENRLIVLYHTRFTPQQRFSNYDGEHAGCFLRLVKPGTADRITDIRFTPADEE
jgi:peptidoglycan/xylan/chitin deacetylase (PgdA/CDA1 family)